MFSLAKILMIGGALLLLAGALLWLGARIFPGGVPGDLTLRRGQTSIYLPIVSSIVLSILATIGLNLVARWFYAGEPRA